MPRSSRPAVVGITIVLALAGGLSLGTGGAASATSAASAVTSATVHSAAASTVYGAGQYVDPDSQPAASAASLRTSDPAGSAAAATIAQYPVATWLGEWSTGTSLVSRLRAETAGAAAAGTTAVFVTYAIPDRDCGGYSAGGMDESTYDAWVDTIAATLAGTRSAVIVEPDSLAMLSNADCSSDVAAERYRILDREVSAFSAAGIPSYLDAGNSNWVAPATMASRLRQAGVANARGFFSNVANYYPTAAEQAYDQQVSAQTGGAHYVIDTSRNGRGWRGTWCNGPGAGLGSTPRVVSDGTALDALLWVKTPGASDGSCDGAPAAGAWYSAYAQALVANAVLAAPTASVAPVATLDSAAGVVGGVALRGWAFDRDAPATPVSIRVTVDGTASTVAANTARADVDRVYGVGAAHGFSVTVAAASGAHQLCVTAVDIGGDADTSLGCRSVTVPDSSPVATLDAAVGVTGGVQLRGWAFDRDALSSAVSIRVTIGGTTSTIAANTSRSDVDRAFGVGVDHGFSATVAAPSGSQTVCVTAENVGNGSDTSLGCRTVTVPDSSPVATLDAATGVVGGVALRGWAFDRDALAAPVSIRVTVDGTASTILANSARSDVDRAFGVGVSHGFAATVAASSGAHQVCVVATNVGNGSDTSLGCRTVTVPDSSPVATLDAATGVAGGVALRGWAFDRDALSSPVSIRVTVAGTTSTITASGARPDVDRAFGVGASHGFAATVASPSGSQSVCITAVNVGNGSDTSLGCRTVAVP